MTCTTNVGKEVASLMRPATHEAAEAEESERDALVAEEEDNENEGLARLWEELASRDYAGVSFDDEGSQEEREDRFIPGFASAPGGNLFEGDVPLEGPLPPPPQQLVDPATAVADTIHTTKSNLKGIDDACYRKLREQAVADYPQPDESDVHREEQPQKKIPVFKPKI
eukprot:TRINITY_DN14398_c0_g1_i1.p1 TRINITY_DN14398_c0_g1~~TRINITY_DN14398_c0_g1_i1.p1  ORF type:complete len:168 (+),score=31.25 TRINITY_DN14398_c0_g1_i1:156-659(+)